MKKIIILLFLFFLLQNQVKAQCWPYPCSPCQIQGEIVVNSADCGITNQITVTLTSGVAPYTFVIKKVNEEAKAPVIQDGRTYKWTNLSAGYYYVWALDSNGCIFTGECVLTGPLMGDVRVDYSCEGNTVCVFVEGGVPPYTYSWSDGICCSTQECRDNLSSDDYSVTVVDANNCTLVIPFFIKEQAKLQLVYDFTQPSCVSSAKIELGPTGGTPPYNFSIKKNNAPYTNKYGNSLKLEHLEAGNYAITITDQNGCQLKKTIVLENFVSQKDTTIFMADCGSITLPWGEVVTSSGIFEHTYMTMNGCDSIVKILVTTTHAHDSIVNIIGSCGVWVSPEGEIFTETGFYVNEIINGEGCPQRLITAIYIEQPIMENIIVPYCFDTTPSVYFGGNEYHQDTILENGCGWTIISFEELEPTKEVEQYETICLAPGEEPFEKKVIIFSLKNVLGCDSINYILNLTGVPSEESIDSVYLCNGESHFWNVTGKYYDKEGIYESIDSSDICPKYYKLVIFKNNNGYIIEEEYSCDTSYYIIMIGENCFPDTIHFISRAPGVFISSNVQNISCFGEDDGEIKLEVFSEDPNYEIFWSDGNDSEILSGLEAGDYSVTVTNSYGCENGASFTVIEPEELKIASVDTINVSCEKGGSIFLEIEGGTGPYEISCNSPNGKLDDLPPGDYTISVTDANGCEVQSETIVFLEPDCYVPPDYSDCEILVKTAMGEDGPYVEINNKQDLEGELTYKIFTLDGYHVYSGSLGIIGAGYHYQGILHLGNLKDGDYAIVFFVNNKVSKWGLCFILKR